MTSRAGRLPKPARAPYPAAANTALSRSVRNRFQIGSAMTSLPQRSLHTAAILCQMGARGGALDQFLHAGLDPGKEAGHHYPHAHPRIPLDVAGVDERAGHAASLGDLLDRAVDRLLDLRVSHVPDLAHRGRQVARGHKEDVDVVDLDDLIEVADADNVLDQHDQKALVVGGLQIVAHAESLAARVHAALAERRELAGC